MTVFQQTYSAMSDEVRVITDPHVINALICIALAIVVVSIPSIVAWFKACAAEETERKKRRGRRDDDDDQYPPRF